MRSDQFPRIRQWRALEKVREHIGCLPVLLSWGGALCILGGILMLVGGTGFHLEIRRVPLVSIGLSPLLEPYVTIVLGVAQLAFARGLWNARLWARGVALAMFATDVAFGALETWRTGENRIGVLSVIGLVYLLLPATARRFRTAAGDDDPEARSTGTGART